MEDKKVCFTKQQLIEIFKRSIVAKLDECGNQNTDDYNIADTDAGILLNFTQDVIESVYQAFLKTHSVIPSPIEKAVDVSCDDSRVVLDNVMKEISNSYIAGLAGDKSYFIQHILIPNATAINRFEGAYSKINDGYCEAMILAEDVQKAKDVLNQYIEYKKTDPFVILQKEINTAVKSLSKLNAKDYGFSKTRDGIGVLRFPNEPLKKAIDLAKLQGEKMKREEQERIEREKREARAREIRPFVDIIADKLNLAKTDEYSYSAESKFYSVQSGLKCIECKDFNFDKCAVVTLSELIDAIRTFNGAKLLEILKGKQIVSKMAKKVLVVDDGYNISDTSIIKCLQNCDFSDIYISDSVKNAFVKNK